jgi:hypothetical protein
LQQTGLGLQQTGFGLQQTGLGVQQTGLGLQHLTIGLQHTGLGLQHFFGLQQPLSLRNKSNSPALACVAESRSAPIENIMIIRFFIFFSPYS